MPGFFEDLFRRISALERRQNNLLRVGTVEECDTAAATVRVRIGKLLTAPLPWLTHRAGSNARTFAAPSVGEQVLVLSPGGELANGVVLPALNYSEFTPPAADAAIDRIIYPDGTVLEYDYDAHALTADVQGDAEITTTGNATATIGGKLTASITGDTSITASANLTLSISAAANVTITGATTLTHTGPLTINAAAAVAVTAASVAITAATVAITGNVAVTGNLTASGTVSAGNPPVGLTTHNHGGAPPVAPS